MGTYSTLEYFAIENESTDLIRRTSPPIVLIRKGLSVAMVSPKKALFNGFEKSFKQKNAGPKESDGPAELHLHSKSKL